MNKCINCKYSAKSQDYKAKYRQVVICRKDINTKLAKGTCKEYKSKFRYKLLLSNMKS